MRKTHRRISPVAARERATRARAWRRRLTRPEAALWSIIRAGKLQGYVFRRQQRVGTHILEFYCPASRLALEIVRRRETPAQTEAAEERLARLEQQHEIRTLRFWHEALEINLYWVSGHVITALRAGQRWPMTWVPPPGWQRHWPDLRAR